MTPLNIVPDLDQHPFEVRDDELLDFTSDPAVLTDIGLIRNGTHEGRAVVGMIVVLPTGQKVVAQTTWRLLQAATRALAAGPIGSEEVLD